MSSGGLYASLRRVVAGSIELVQLRLELFATELEQEKRRVFAALAWAVLALLLLEAALLVVAALVVVLFWETHRIAALALLALAFAAGAWLAWRTARAGLAPTEGAFALTRAELKRDREAAGPPQA